MAGLGWVESLRNASLQQITDEIGTSGDLRVFSGARPATGGAETTVMATLPLSAVAAPAPAGGVWIANPITSDGAVAVSGLPDWARLRTSVGAAVVDMDASVRATVTNRARTANVATLTTAADHGFVVGDELTVAGVGAGFDDAAAVVTSVPTSTTFTYANVGADVAPEAATGTVEQNDSLVFDQPLQAGGSAGCSSLTITDGNP